MAHSLDPVPVWIKREGSKVIRVILWSQPRLTVASATGGKSRSVERLNRCPVGSTEAYVHARRGHRLARLSRDRELHAKRHSQSHVARSRRCERSRGVAGRRHKPAAPPQGFYPDQNVIEHASPQ